MATRSLPNHRRGRHIVVWGVGAFMACHLVGSVLLDYCWQRVRFPTAAYLFDALRERGRAPDVVILGSSRIGLGFSAAEAGDALRRRFPTGRALTVFNAAVPSGDLATSDFVLAEMVRQGQCPAVAVIELSPENVSRYNDWIGYDVRRLFRWSDLPTYLPDIVADGAVQRLLMQRLFPLCVHRSEIRSCALEAVGRRLGCSFEGEIPGQPKLVSDQSGLDSQGLFGETFRSIAASTRGVNGSPDTQDDIRLFRHWLARYEIGGTAAADLERLLQRCRDHQITPVLVALPLASGYRELYTPHVNEAFAAYMASVARKYACRFVDYRTLFPDRYFFDHTHLLPDGSRILTQILVRDVLIPAWQERPARETGRAP
jgi:hypothetical protein